MADFPAPGRSGAAGVAAGQPELRARAAGRGVAATGESAAARRRPHRGLGEPGTRPPSRVASVSWRAGCVTPPWSSWRSTTARALQPPMAPPGPTRPPSAATHNNGFGLVVQLEPAGRRHPYRPGLGGWRRVRAGDVHRHHPGGRVSARDTRRGGGSRLSQSGRSRPADLAAGPAELRAGARPREPDGPVSGWGRRRRAGGRRHVLFERYGRRRSSRPLSRQTGVFSGRLRLCRLAARSVWLRRP